MTVLSTSRTLTGAIRELRDDARRAARPTSTVRVGDWVLEARPEGLVAVHASTGTVAVVAAPPTEGEG